MDQTNDGQGTPTEVFETPEMKEINPRLVQEKEMELKPRSKPADSNSTESQETKDRDKNLADKLELTTEEESDNSHQRQTKKCFSYKEYSLLLHCHLTKNDRVLISHEEILVFPSDYSNDNDWVQTAIINRNRDRDKVFYSRTDAARLEKFLLQEQNAMQQAVQKKCNFHSTQCDTVTAKQVDKDKFLITHEYQSHNLTDITYEPSRTKIQHCGGHEPFKEGN